MWIDFSHIERSLADCKLEDDCLSGEFVLVGGMVMKG